MKTKIERGVRAMKARMIIGITILFIMAAIAPPIFAATVDIDSWADLHDVGHLSSAQTQGNTYNLTRSLTTSDSDYNGIGNNFVPIGSGDSGNSYWAFSGTFNGNGNTISGLTITGYGQAGLFGYTTGATINDVHLSNLQIQDSVVSQGANPQGGAQWVGGLVGSNDASTVITKSSVSGTIVTNDYSKYVAGLVGQNFGTISDSFAQVNVTGGAVGSDNFGGLVGDNEGTISRAYATGTITSWTMAGGFVGWNGGTITDSFATGVATQGPGTGVAGGFDGWASGMFTNDWWFNTTNTGGWHANQAGAAADFYGTGSGTGGAVYTSWSPSTWTFTSGAYPALGSGGAVPEPATVVGLVIAAVGMIARKRLFRRQS